MKKLVVNISSSNADFILMKGNFNIKSSNWSSNDTNTAESAQLNCLTWIYGMKQVITIKYLFKTPFKKWIFFTLNA